MVDLIWNVYYFNPNKDEVEVKNLFKISSTFNKDLQDIYEKVNKGECSFLEYKECLKKALQYTFWCRREYEIAVSDLCWTYKDATDEMKVIQYEKYCKTAEKIDIYSQVMMNWNAFVDYVWNEVKRNG